MVETDSREGAVLLVLWSDEPLCFRQVGHFRQHLQFDLVHLVRQTGDQTTSLGLIEIVAVVLDRVHDCPDSMLHGECILPRRTTVFGVHAERLALKILQNLVRQVHILSAVLDHLGCSPKAPVVEVNLGIGQTDTPCT